MFWECLAKVVPRDFGNHDLPTVLSHTVGCCSSASFQICKIPLTIKPLMFLLLSGFFGLRVGQVQGLQACGVQPNR